MKGEYKVQETVVLKCGGSSVDDLSDAFFSNIKKIQDDGYKIVIVHGGGPAIKSILEKLEIETEFVDGLRYTNESVIDVVEMVLSGKVNSSLTRRVNESNLRAVGLAGTDDHLLTAEAIDLDKYGLVGEVKDVNVDLINDLTDQGIVPVISPLALSQDGKRLNVNADSAAGAIAKALAASQLVFVTDVPGILKRGELLETVSEAEINDLIQEGTIYDGMIPKVKAALNGLTKDIQVKIVDGKHSDLTSENKLKGTTIIK